MIAVRCGACRRQLGLSTTAPTHRVYCNSFCAKQRPTGVEEQRNDLIRLLRSQGLSTLQIAIRTGLSRQRIAKILEAA